MRARTRTLTKISGGSFRLSSDDREFLLDLAKVRLIAEQDADQFHYGDRKTGAAKRLDRLVDQGLLKRTDLTIPGQGRVKAYGFGNEDIAKKFGSKLPRVSRMRNAFHELIVSRLYFAENRPETYKVEADFTQQDIEMIRRPGQSISEVSTPDAMFMGSDGKPVVVEADSGQYNSTQIRQKISSWSGLKQVWGQPQFRKSAVENYSDATVHRF